MWGSLSVPSRLHVQPYSCLTLAWPDLTWLNAVCPYPCKQLLYKLAHLLIHTSVLQFISFPRTGPLSSSVFCLGTVYLSVDHTGQTIAETITDIFDNWDLPPDKVVATITTDNGQCSIFWLRLDVGCFGQNLDLAIEESKGAIRGYNNV